MTTYFLAIGINHYTDRAFRALSCCENDATELHSLFKRNLELGDRARKLVGAVSIGDVKNELRRIGQEIRNGDTFVFFFAGHGYQHPKNEDQYLLFPDADAILVNNGHRDGMLALSALRDLTEHWTGVARLFILDACRSWLPGRGAEGARFDNEMALAYLSSRSPRLSPELEIPGNATAPSGGALPPVILNATRNGQEAKELEDRQRGVLALALEQSLEKQQQSGQVIYLGDRMLGDINRRMHDLLQQGRLGVEQTPFLTPPSAQVLLFKPVRTTEPAHDDDETEWTIACAKDTIEAYEAYARRKPPGKYRTEALKRITELSQWQKQQTPPIQQHPPVVVPEPGTAKPPIIESVAPTSATTQVNSTTQFESTESLSCKPISQSTPLPIAKPSLIEGIKINESAESPKLKLVLFLITLLMVIGIGILKNRSKEATTAERPSPEISDAAEMASLPPLSVFHNRLKGGGEGPAMVVIRASTKEFSMGSNDGNSNEKPIRQVSIRQSYALGRTEVTQKEWRQIMGSDPPGLKFKGCDDCPVENVSWNDAQSYIKKLNEQTGKTYRLPSEAEWEYACRAGKANEAYCGGNDPDILSWYDKNSGDKTHPVAEKKPNAWGLYDMSGNVWELIEDQYHNNFNDIAAPTDGSAWVSAIEPKHQVIRGGSWYSFPPRNVRSASRFLLRPDDRDPTVGFRVARTLP